MDKLGRDPRFVILLKSDPITVLQLCRIDTKYADLCRDESVFIRLMEEHYPQFPIDENNPKEQYGNITSRIGITYKVGVHIINDGTIPAWAHTSVDKFIFDTKAYPEDEFVNSNKYIDVVSFTILGTRIRKGEKVILLVYRGDSEWGNAELETQAFLNYDLAANKLMYDYHAEWSDRIIKIFLIDKDLEDIEDIEPEELDKLLDSGEIHEYADKNYGFDLNEQNSIDAFAQARYFGDPLHDGSVWTLEEVELQ